MTASCTRVALNPLPWTLGPTGFAPLSRTALPAVLTEVRAAGFSAVMTDVPSGMSGDVYAELLGDAGLAPAPGYFAADFEDDRLVGAIAADARAAARQHRELGLREMFLAGGMVPARLTRPAVGADFDPTRLASFVRNLTVVARAISEEGVRGCLHPHVGSLVESEQEVRGVLEDTDPDVVAFGPDTGHLAWAGMEPADIIGDYADRVAAVHLKDVHHAVATAARAEEQCYDEATRLRHLWAEPGGGDVDLARVVDVLAGEFTGWWIVEVDVPDKGLTPAESAALSAEWVRRHLTDPENDTHWTPVPAPDLHGRPTRDNPRGRHHPGADRAPVTHEGAGN